MLGNFHPECLENTLQASKQWKDVKKSKQNNVERLIAKLNSCACHIASESLQIPIVLPTWCISRHLYHLCPPWPHRPIPYTTRTNVPCVCRVCKVRHAATPSGWELFQLSPVKSQLYIRPRQKHQSPSERSPACASSMKLFSYVKGCKLSSISTVSLSKAGFDFPSRTSRNMEFHSKNHESVRCCKHWLWNAYSSICPVLFPLHSSMAKKHAQILNFRLLKKKGCWKNGVFGVFCDFGWLCCGSSFCLFCPSNIGSMWNISANYLCYSMY